MNKLSILAMLKLDDVALYIELSIHWNLLNCAHRTTITQASVNNDIWTLTQYNTIYVPNKYLDKRLLWGSLTCVLPGKSEINWRYQNNIFHNAEWSEMEHFLRTRSPYIYDFLYIDTQERWKLKTIHFIRYMYNE